MKFSIKPFDNEGEYNEIIIPLNSGVTIIVKGQKIKIDILEVKE